MFMKDKMVTDQLIPSSNQTSELGLKLESNSPFTISSFKLNTL